MQWLPNVMDKFCPLVVEVNFSRLPKQNACVDSWDSMKPLCKGAMPARGAIYEKEVFRICHGPPLTLIFPSGPDTLALATVFKVPWPLAERALA